MTPYFGERENGPLPRTEQEISMPVWRGVIAAITEAKDRAFLAEAYSARECGDGDYITGTSTQRLNQALEGEHPQIQVPLTDEQLPETIPVLELIEFVHRHVSKPTSANFHGYFGHTHYGGFSKEEGQTEFADRINSIFRRHQLAYELQPLGNVVRLLPPVLNEALLSAEFFSGDPALDRLLISARQRFLSPVFTFATMP